MYEADDATLGRHLAQRTLDLVRIPSPSGEEEAVADYVRGVLRERAAPSWMRRHRSAVVAGFGAGEPRVVLGGHLDTVPLAGAAPPGLGQGEVRGRGSTDMKGGLAVMLTLAEAASGDPGVGAVPFATVFYDREETAFEHNGLRPLFELEPWLARAELALMLEPTANAIELGCLGTLHARVTFTGKAAHSARPWTGANAIHLAAPFLARLAALPEREHRDGPAVFREVVSVTRAEGGRARNVLPDRFTLNVNLRFAPDRSAEEAEGYLRSLVPAEAEVLVTDLAPAAAARLDAPLLARLVAESGCAVRAKQAWTDVAQFAERGVAAANFGPGIPEAAHADDERIPIENLVRSFRILRAFLAPGSSHEDPAR